MTTDPAELQKRFNVPGIRFDAGRGGMPRVVVSTHAATAEIYLHGAHVTRYEPAGQKPVLWVSRESLFQPDKAIRGGVPICFPWFGPKPGDPAAPMHGFARVMEWRVESVQPTADGVTLVFALDADDRTRKYWPGEFGARYEVRVGRHLYLSLRVHNRGSEAFTFEEALHTYFSVGDARRATVAGLEGTSYVDKTDGMKRKPQGNGPVTIEAETDRVYLDTRAATVIDDPAAGRKIHVGKHGSNATVVWNPWVAKAKAMADFGDDEWEGMLCVETVNAGDSGVPLAAGASHEMAATIEVVG